MRKVVNPALLDMKKYYFFAKRARSIPSILDTRIAKTALASGL